jgi:DNA-binding FadR family transcriptional regulator
MKNENLKKKSKSREIIEDILSEIEQSNIKIGDKLPSERSLAEKYNVSRIVIREVISYLKAIGVVESVQGSGNYVKDYPKQEYFDLNYLDYDVDDLLESRKILEQASATLVFKNMDDELIKELERIVRDFTKAVKAKDLNETLEQDYLFHKIYASYTQNPILENILDNLTSFIQDRVWKIIKKEYLFTNTYNKKTLENHRNILNALKNRDLNQLLFYIEMHYDTIIRGLKK